MGLRYWLAERVHRLALRIAPAEDRHPLVAHSLCSLRIVGAWIPPTTRQLDDAPPLRSAIDDDVLMMIRDRLRAVADASSDERRR